MLWVFINGGCNNGISLIAASCGYLIPVPFCKINPLPWVGMHKTSKFAFLCGDSHETLVKWSWAPHVQILRYECHPWAPTEDKWQCFPRWLYPLHQHSLMRSSTIKVLSLFLHGQSVSARNGQSAPNNGSMSVHTMCPPLFENSNWYAMTFHWNDWVLSR